VGLWFFLSCFPRYIVWDGWLSAFLIYFLASQGEVLEITNGLGQELYGKELNFSGNRRFNGGRGLIAKALSVTKQRH
jgi:hypothetical protein